jgi:decaprenylphospho-beta-D-ribofuranose 2-oxidase
VEPGLTLCQLWQTVLPAGWWPPVVSGTMTTTLGGCLGANIHGKNAFRMGPIGEHVTGFTALLPSGAELTCTPHKNGDLFHALISGLGLLGVFTSITLQMKPVHSGLLNVHAWGVPNLPTHLEGILSAAPEHNYTVGWLDPTARGRGLGRGQLHTADYLEEGEDPAPARTLSLDNQVLPDKFFGLVPKSLLHYFMTPFMNNLGVWGVNTAKYILGSSDKHYQQTHAAFHFLLDYIPGWELAYGQLIQHQSFLPRATALQAWTEMLTLSQRRSLPSFLGVTKRHRPDKFLLTHAVDGYSLALDFKVTRGNRQALSAMLRDFDRIVLEAGGRFYFAKNSETSAATALHFLGEETIDHFRQLKKRCDPHNLLESDLYRRIFEPNR